MSLARISAVRALQSLRAVDYWPNSWLSLSENHCAHSWVDASLPPHQAKSIESLEEPMIMLLLQQSCTSHPISICISFASCLQCHCRSELSLGTRTTRILSTAWHISNSLSILLSANTFMTSKFWIRYSFTIRSITVVVSATAGCWYMISDHLSYRSIRADDNNSNCEVVTSQNKLLISINTSLFIQNKSQYRHISSADNMLLPTILHKVRNEMSEI